MKLKGGCVHHDNGPLGSRAYDRAEERRVELLKASGYNAIRCAHNPPSPAFLDACDRIGMLVMDESFDMWEDAKNYSDYHLYFNEFWKKDIESMVLRDRNHPSIIMWSIGNEIPNRHTLKVAMTSKMLADYVRELDPTRPVTSAVNGVSENKDAYFSTLDIAGYNYALNRYTIDHTRVRQRIIVCTESFPLNAFDYWMGVIDNPYVIGDFVWTSFDYMGEASIGWLGFPRQQSFYPWNLAYCGDIDICGWKRPQSFYRDALWKENQLSIFVKPAKSSFEEEQSSSRWTWNDVVADWNWKGYEGQPLEVNVYSSCEKVELFLNGKSLGEKPTNRAGKYMATWQVPYQAGNLKAIGYRGRKQVNVTELNTSGDVAQLKLKADRVQLKADGQDLAYVTIELADANGVLNPKADNLVKFEIEGPGTIVGVGNANPVSLESNQKPQRKAWRGRCLVIIKSEHKPGKILLRATTETIGPALIELYSEN
jgi:beta-galactosidase